MAPFQPVAGVSFVGRVWSDPWRYFAEDASWCGIPPRGVPWTAVRIYVERLDGPQELLCRVVAGNTLAGSVNLPGRSGPFVPLSVVAGFGEYNSEPGYPAIEATTDPTIDPSSMLYYDHVLLFFGKSLVASSVYHFSEGYPGFEVTLAFSSPSIKDEDSGYPTTFVSVSGTLNLNEFGISQGNRVRGSFSVALSGDRVIRTGDDFEYQTINGTIDGSFDVILGASQIAPLSVELGRVTLAPRP